MENKPYPAFGYVIVLTKLKAGEVITDELLNQNVISIQNPSPDRNGSINGSNGMWIWTMIKGVHKYTNLTTNEVSIHQHGFSNLETPMTEGVFKLEVIEDSEFACFSPVDNKDRSPTIPDLEFFRLEVGRSCELKQNTKLYLIDGELIIAGNKIGSMRQIKFFSGDQVVTANKNSLGYIFKD
jgi:hypothetical protein